MIICASEVTTIWRYTNVYIIIIIIAHKVSSDKIQLYRYTLCVAFWQLIDRQNYETLGTSHACPSLTVTKLSTFKNSLGFFAHTV